MLFLAKFESSVDVVVDAESPERALYAIEREIDDTPIELREIPAGTFVAEVHWEDSGNPAARASSDGLVFEPCSAMIAWLEADDERDAPAATTTETKPAPSGEVSDV